MKTVGELSSLAACYIQEWLFHAAFHVPTHWAAFMKI